MKMKSNRILAASLLKCGVNRVWIDPARLDDVNSAITRDEIRKLIHEGVIKAKSKVGVSRYRYRLKREKRKRGSLLKDPKFVAQEGVSLKYVPKSVPVLGEIAVSGTKIKPRIEAYSELVKRGLSERVGGGVNLQTARKVTFDILQRAASSEASIEDKKMARAVKEQIRAMSRKIGGRGSGYNLLSDPKLIAQRKVPFEMASRTGLKRYLVEQEKLRSAKKKTDRTGVARAREELEKITKYLHKKFLQTKAKEIEKLVKDAKGKKEIELTKKLKKVADELGKI